jgi:type 1 glutamine amidotransferase
VIFYTTGYLTEAGSDGHPPMGENGLKELLDWISSGGSFVGLHSATDSFHSKGDEVSSYIEMIGGEFETHGQQFKGALRIASPGHPAVASLPDGWAAFEEWYINKNLNTEKMHVLALLEVGDKTRQRQEKYNMPDYPIVWCRAYGPGRVLYNGLGHNEAVWEADVFQKLLADNLKWAAGEGELKADPNYDQVVPKTIEKK